ncbi:hypothetical protein PR202_gb29431 [Eleusine coracana subsp. coracana]|uniref:Partial AB-hydrolase lipase domain-containing protein n=1 Tax=Eleusine coracana subsp. coracana TaxID=191504 RepID=A0AAV5G0A4_ELECO|nr:hypothetical protein PR202_gb29431 [Eleusine coracana subsp. coracana]
MVWSGRSQVWNLVHIPQPPNSESRLGTAAAGMVGPGALATAPPLLLLLFCCLAAGARASPATDALRRVAPRSTGGGGLCEQLLLPLGYPCTEHTVSTSCPLAVLNIFDTNFALEQIETNDGFLLSIQHIPRGKNGVADNAGPPVFLQHGLFQGGDTWFINSPEQSLGYILADNGFDVWIGNGTIMGLAALTMPEVVKMISSAALLCPISYLDHVSAGFVLRAVAMHLDQMLVTMGIHQLNFRRSKLLLQFITN